MSELLDDVKRASARLKREGANHLAVALEFAAANMGPLCKHPACQERLAGVLREMGGAGIHARAAQLFADILPQLGSVPASEVERACAEMLAQLSELEVPCVQVPAP